MTSYETVAKPISGSTKQKAPEPSSVDADAQQLAALGYTAQFDRTMTLWENFSLGFTYLSPVVGVYTLFAYCLATGGPPMFWSYILVGIGQFLVCLVFCEVVSQFPIAGGVYPWARRLVGKRWAWMVGWGYAWALFASIAGIAAGCGPYLAQLLGLEPSPTTDILVALGLIALTTIINISGTRFLATVAMIGFICELGGALVVGGYLLTFERVQPLSILFDTFEIGAGGSYLPAFLAAAMGAFFQYYGFEACGDVAEETPDPSRMIPRAMRMTIYIGGAAALFVLLALLLSVPDIGAVIRGENTDPIMSVLDRAFGPIGSKMVLGVVMVSFLSCLLSLQAAASRLLFAYARDNMIFGSSVLQKISSAHHVPVPALLVAGVLPAAIVCAGFFIKDVVTTIVSFGAIGIYFAFQMIVLAALIARLRGWRPAGQFSLGAFGWLVNIAALAYGVGAIANMVWPRTPDVPWYVNYGMLLTSLIVFLTGLFYMYAFRPFERGTAPAGDAWKLSRQA
ncbi:MAG TPA: amino acid permease [Azospirillum sp.]|nr:amino acid permease [Azospirillum sp.]